MCKVNGIKVETGDNVCISSDNEAVCVAQIQELYKSLTMKKDPNRAKVLWYFTPNCFPSKIRKMLPDGVNQNVTKNELFLPLDQIERSSNNIRFTEDLDVETISGKCKVKEIRTQEVNCDSIRSFKNNEYFVRYRFDEKFNFIPVFNQSNWKGKQSKDKSLVTPRKVLTPSKLGGTPVNPSKTHSRYCSTPLTSTSNQSEKSKTPLKSSKSLQRKKLNNQKVKEEEQNEGRVTRTKSKEQTTQDKYTLSAKSRQKSRKANYSGVQDSVKVCINNIDLKSYRTPQKRKASRSIPDQSSIDKKRNKPHPPVKEWVSPKLGKCNTYASYFYHKRGGWICNVSRNISYQGWDIMLILFYF